MHWFPNGQTVNKEYFVEVLREFRKIILKIMLKFYTNLIVYQYKTIILQMGASSGVMVSKLE